MDAIVEVDLDKFLGGCSDIPPAKLRLVRDNIRKTKAKQLREAERILIKAQQKRDESTAA